MKLTVGLLDTGDRPPSGFLGRHSVTYLRWALGVTYVWFGALKLAGKSPIADMVRKMNLFLPKSAVVPIMGTLEVVIGVGLLSRIALRFTLLLFFGQIASTFLFLVMRPREAFQEGNPMLLTERGEFIMKNLVLLSAGVAVASTAGRKNEKLVVSG